MTREEKIIVAKRLAQGGWSSIYSFVSDVSDDVIDYWTDENEEEDEDEEI